MIILYFVLAFLLFVLVSFCVIALLTPLFSKVPFVPCRSSVLREIVDALNLNDNSVLYDLGCGDGRVLFTVTKNYKNVSCIGYEIAPFPYMLAKMRKFFSRAKNVSIFYGDFFKVDLSNASHLFLYLFPALLDELLPKFQKELKKGTRIVSCDFKFKNMEPAEVIEMKSKKWQTNRKLYVYIF